MHNKLKEIKQIIAPIAIEISTPNRSKRPPSRGISASCVSFAAAVQSSAGNIGVSAAFIVLRSACEAFKSIANAHTHITACEIAVESAAPLMFSAGIGMSSMFSASFSPAPEMLITAAVPCFSHACNAVRQGTATPMNAAPMPSIASGRADTEISAAAPPKKEPQYRFGKRAYPQTARQTKPCR